MTPNEDAARLRPDRHVSQAGAAGGRRWRWWYLVFGGIGVVVLFFIALVIQALVGMRTGDDLANFSADGRLTAATGIAVGTATDRADDHSDDDPDLGRRDAPVQIIAFEDFQCPFCRESYPIVRRLMERYKDRVHFIYRDFPVASLHPLAQKAAEAGQCAWEQGQNQFWSLHDRIYQNQETISEGNLVLWAKLAGADEARLRTCLAAGTYATEVQQDLEDGAAAGVRGTPTFFFNGRKVEGAIPEDLFEKAIRSLL